MIRTNYPNPTRSAAATPVRPVHQTGPNYPKHTTGQTGPSDRSDRSYFDQARMVESCPRFIVRKLQLRNSFLNHTGTLGEFKEEIH